MHINNHPSFTEPSEAPSRAWARAVSASEIEVFWEPVPPRSNSEKIVAYEVGKQKKSETFKQRHKINPR